MASKASLLVDFNNIIKPNNLNNLIAKIQPLPETTKYHIGLVLIIPKYQLQLLEKIPVGYGRVQYINSVEFVNSIEGVAYLIYNKRKKICEITGMSRYIIKKVLESILLYIPNDVTLWVNININHDNLTEIIDNYANAGFRNPYISIKSPLGSALGYYGLCMVRKNSPEKIEKAENTLNDVTYVLEQFINREEQNCKLKVKLGKDTVAYLKQLSRTGSTLNHNGSVSQKEIAGSFILSNANDNLVYTIDVDKTSIIAGSEEGVPVMQSQYNFHTHPKEAYDRHNVKIGWPSSQDYLGYLGAVAQFGTIFHTVISLEGIYIISLHDYWVDKLDKLDDSVVSYIKKNYNIAYTDGKNIKWYLRTINNLSYGDWPLFLIQYFSWENATRPFMVSYIRDGLNCFTS